MANTLILNTHSCILINDHCFHTFRLKSCYSNTNWAIAISHDHICIFFNQLNKCLHGILFITVACVMKLNDNSPAMRKCLQIMDKQPDLCPLYVRYLIPQISWNSKFKITYNYFESRIQVDEIATISMTNQRLISLQLPQDHF